MSANCTGAISADRAHTTKRPMRKSMAGSGSLFPTRSIHPSMRFTRPVGASVWVESMAVAGGWRDGGSWRRDKVGGGVSGATVEVVRSIRQASGTRTVPLRRCTNDSAAPVEYGGRRCASHEAPTPLWSPSPWGPVPREAESLPSSRTRSSATRPTNPLDSSSVLDTPPYRRPEPGSRSGSTLSWTRPGSSGTRPPLRFEPGRRMKLRVRNRASTDGRSSDPMRCGLRKAANSNQPSIREAQ